MSRRIFIQRLHVNSNISWQNLNFATFFEFSERLCLVLFNISSGFLDRLSLYPVNFAQNLTKIGLSPSKCSKSRRLGTSDQISMKFITDACLHNTISCAKFKSKLFRTSKVITHWNLRGFDRKLLRCFQQWPN